MQFQKVGLIGCGNMGGAIARACAGKAELWLANRTAEKAAALAAELGAKTGGNTKIAQSCDLIFLGVKPQMMPGVLAEIAPVLALRKDRFVLATMAAGLEIATIRSMAGGEYPVIRIMPNTPVSVGEGVILYCDAGVTPDEKAAFFDLMSAAGILDELPEGLINAGCAISGCGPAFVYPVIEALADGAVACGLPRAKAQEYAAQTLLGAAKLVLESGSHPGALKDAVCSPGGSTIQGVRVLEERGVRGAMFDAVVAAYEKTAGLGSVK